MKKYLPFLFLACSFHSKAQVEFQPGTELHTMKEQHGENLALLIQDSQSYYIEVGGDMLAVKCSLQKFDKATNKLVYSVPNEAIRYLHMTEFQNTIFVFKDHYSSEKKEQIIEYKTINKQDGTSSEYKELPGIPMVGGNKSTYTYSGENVLISLETSDPGQAQQMEMLVFNMNTQSITADHQIPKLPELTNIFIVSSAIDPEGNISFTYYKNPSQKDIAFLKDIKNHRGNMKQNFAEVDYNYVYSKWEREDKSMWMGYIKKGNADALLTKIDMGGIFFPDPNTLSISRSGQDIFIDGLYFKGWLVTDSTKCNAGLFHAKLNPENRSISELSRESFNEDLNNKLSALPSAGNACERNYRLLHLIKNDDYIFFVYQVFNPALAGVMVTPKPGAINPREINSRTAQIPGNLLVSRFNIKSNKFEWIKMLPYNYDQAGHYFLNIGINAAVIKNRLYVLHLDNVANTDNLLNFDAARVTGFTPKGANLVCVTIDETGNASKQVLFSNSKELYAYPDPKNIFLAEGKLLMHSRGRAKEAFDRYGFVEIK